ncbi:MAG TPA: riboflavin synthase [Candidatus Binataceae bacterium]|nr:riboflavin synthase [Candidatus Binataceae bacterium]
MYTGIIEDLGTVASIKPVPQGAVMTVKTALPTARITIGDSVCFNGVCVTVVSRGRGKIAADLSAETLRRSTLGSLKAGDRVNLERCLTLDKLINGHLVAGHVDGVARIVSIKAEGSSKLFTFEAPAAETRYLIEKGSVALDGISLTCFGIKGRQFSVELIPHTLKVTTLGYKKAGDKVNFESDMLVKYVEKMLVGRRLVPVAAAGA